jgi:hypothetical protein
MLDKKEERTEEVVEEFTDVFVGLESIINGGLEFSIHVPEVELGSALGHEFSAVKAHLSVESQEDLVCISVLPNDASWTTDRSGPRQRRALDQAIHLIGSVAIVSSFPLYYATPRIKMTYLGKFLPS